MSFHSEETPPPPPLSEAPPSYCSRDTLDSPHPTHDSPHFTHDPPHHTHDPPYPTHEPPHFRNPRFEPLDNVSLDENSQEYDNDRGSCDDPPPPYSPGLGAIFSTRLNSSHHDVNDAPPSYYSLFGQIREAREQSSNNFTFLRRVGQIVLNTVGCTILLLVFMSVPITILVIGSIFVHDCCLERFIPIYLIVGGISGILKNVFLILENIIQRYSEQLSSRIKHSKYIVYTWRVFNLIFNLFMLAWTIAGGYWVYHIYTEVTDSGYRECRELLYKFGFGIVTSSYILLLLTCVCVCCCVGICLKVTKRRRRRESDQGSERDSDDESHSLEADSEQRDYQSDEDSMFAEGDYRMDTLTSNVDDSHEPDSEEFLRRFRHLDSTDPVNTEDYNRGLRVNGAILRYDSSPYPTRHRGIRHSPQQEYTTGSSSQQPPTPNSLSSTPSHPPDSTQLRSDSNVRFAPVGETPQENRTHSLYVTISTEGYSITEV